ncbi:MAG: ribonuclease H-like domain-containing protein, partial [Pseudomonadota bacterium]
RICCFGYRSREAGPATMVLADEDDGAERELLRNAWALLGIHNHFVTFNGLPFDIPVLLARSLILGVEPIVTIDRGKYVARNHVDLRNLLTNGDKFMKGRLGFFAQRILGRTLATDPGSAVQGHWDDGAEGRAKIASHCAEDVSATWDLDERLVDSGCYNL